MFIGKTKETDHESVGFAHFKQDNCKKTCDKRANPTDSFKSCGHFTYNR